MYLSDTLRVLARRWWLVALGAIATIAAVGYTLVTVPTEYQADAQVLLLPPPQPPVGSNRSNPYLEVQHGLVLLASLVAADMKVPELKDQFVSEGVLSDFSIIVYPDSGPIITILTEDTDQGAAVRTRDRLATEITGRIAARQLAEDVADRWTIDSTVVGAEPYSTVRPGARIKALALVMLLGVAATLSLVFVVERRWPGGRPAPQLVGTES
ncbi:MAG: Wzz/FepE/Etk N-terminal domain-containing protein [Acidimicrobiales bacterium]